MKNLAMFHILLPTIKELLYFQFFSRKSQVTNSSCQWVLNLLRMLGTKEYRDTSTKLKSSSFHFLCVIYEFMAL
jgi:cytochrome b subunit of formate dehydrogenase